MPNDTRKNGQISEKLIISSYQYNRIPAASQVHFEAVGDKYEFTQPIYFEVGPEKQSDHEGYKYTVQYGKQSAAGHFGRITAHRLTLDSFGFVTFHHHTSALGLSQEEFAKQARAHCAAVGYELS